MGKRGRNAGSWISGSNENTNFAADYLNVIVMDATKPMGIMNRETNTETTMAGSPEETSAREISGHSFGGIQPNSFHAGALNSIQVENLYLTAIGITKLFRTKHIGVPYSESKVELVPDYL